MPSQRPTNIRNQPIVEQRKRASRACDFCHTRGLKCRRGAFANNGGPVGPLTSCLTCSDYGAQCTINRPVRKRGRKPAVPRSAELVNADKHGHTANQETVNAEESIRVSEQAAAANFRSLAIVRRLVLIYCDTMYQCYFPFLPESDLLTRWDTSIPSPEEPSYMLLMALCAVSSQIASLNAVFNHALLDGLALPDSEQYFLEAASKIPFRIAQSEDLDYLRAFGLLAVYSLQRGNHGDLHRYLGLYHALVAQQGFHDESRWPENLSISEVDDRRRLFWCVYRLEIHSACVLGHVVHMPESQVSVQYPRITPAMEPETRVWTAGWDYITDLFRFLEYAIFSMRGGKNRKPDLSGFCERPSPMTLLDGLARIKASKPRILHGLNTPEGALQSNRCKYMAIQIICTETLVNIMALLYCEAPAREIMDIAEAFLEGVGTASLIMFKVAGSQIVHQLLGVGHMLFNASRFENGRHWAEAKRLIAFLGDLVKNLEYDIPSAAEAGDRLQRLAHTDSTRY